MNKGKIYTKRDTFNVHKISRNLENFFLVKEDITTLTKPVSDHLFSFIGVIIQSQLMQTLNRSVRAKPNLY